MSKCQLPPSGWECTRHAGHEGPCAAVPVDKQYNDALTFIESLTTEYHRENSALKNAYLHPPKGMNPCESVREELHRRIMNYERDINYIFKVKRITTYAMENFT